MTSRIGRAAIIMIAAFAVCSVALSSVQAATIFKAVLTGDGMVPPVATPHSGLATAILNDAMDTLTFTVEHDVVDTTQAFVGRGAVGENGPVAFSLFNNNTSGDNNFITATWDATSALTSFDVTELFAGALFVRVHSQAFLPGEIRGQLLEVIPIPAALPLLLTSLASLGIIGWRRRRQHD